LHIDFYNCRCVDAIKSSAYSFLAADLEINKAMVFLHNRETQLAIDTLKMLENRDTKANSAAVTMLSFIYYLVSKIYEYVLYFIYLRISKCKNF
jgi:hypothetical protein